MRCMICRSAIAPHEETHRCDQCQCYFHKDCWVENEGCATPGCPNVPEKVVSRDEASDEISYWGATTKLCPACGETIPVKEIDCPFCGEHFKSIAPMTAQEMKRGLVHRRGGIREKNIALTVFFSGLVGFTAPVNLIWGGLWYFRNHSALRRDSPAHYLLASAGLLFSILYMLLFLVGAFRST